MLATRRNMRAVAGRTDVFCWSPRTHEEYSATPGDYFLLGDDEPLLDDDNQPMILARRVTAIVEL